MHEESEITPESRVVMFSGSGMPSSLQAGLMLAQIAALIPPGMEIATRARAPETEPKREPLTEIERWNAEVDRRKAERKARK